MNTYRCELQHFSLESKLAKVKLLDDHKGLGGQAGEICTTSAVKFIDFERKFMVTQNNIYTWR